MNEGAGLRSRNEGGPVKVQGRDDQDYGIFLVRTTSPGHGFVFRKKGGGKKQKGWQGSGNTEKKRAENLRNTPEANGGGDRL